MRINVENMNVIQLLFVVWLGASCCLTKIINESLKTEELKKLEEATVNILLKCYETEWNTVGVAGNCTSSLFKTLLSQQSFAVTLIGNGTYDRHVTRGSRHKLQLFIVMASTSDQLNKTLRHVKKSLWWNHMSTFLILDWKFTNTKDACSNAYDYLWTSWEMNLLKATYLCVHKTKGILIYTYNPYTQNAPEPWHLENTYEGKNEHPWTMFSREYKIDNEICRNLEFAKTNDLGGYEIRGTSNLFAPDVPRDSKNHVILDSLNGSGDMIRRYIFHTLNATLRLQVPAVKTVTSLLDTINNDITMHTADDGNDLVLDGLPYLGLLNYSVSSRLSQIEYNILTRYSGQQSQLRKLLTVLDSSSRIGLCLVILIVVVFFKFLRRESLGQAILNTLQIFTYSGLKKVPTNQGARIFLAGVFILVVTIVGIYQGLLASLLTKSKPLKDVETLEDLAKSGYAIHSFEFLAPLFTTPKFKNQFIGHENSQCLEFVLNDSSAACVALKTYASEKAILLNLHVSRESVYESPLVLVIREDWPLEERFNEILGAIVNGRVSPQMQMKAYWKKFNSIARQNELMKSNKPRVMNLNDLKFAFVILGIGWSIATAVFFVEIDLFSLLLSKIRSVYSNTRN